MSSTSTSTSTGVAVSVAVVLFIIVAVGDMAVDELVGDELFRRDVVRESRHELRC